MMMVFGFIMSDKILTNIFKKEALDVIHRKSLLYHKGPINSAKRKYKISICTTCMNRAEDVKQTLLQNIADNIGYGKVEFVLLNYNSTDGLDRWVKDEAANYIDNGILNYYRTYEPKFYSMTHSRNVAFKLAQGDIVNNVDSDHFTNPGFAERINLLANQGVKKPMFIKSSQKNRGRIGFFKKQFMWLGGYNEYIRGYGFDDEDLRIRACAVGFIALKFGGQFFSHVQDHKRHPVKNYENKDWKYTQRLNTMISILNYFGGYFVANKGRLWGKARVIKNFSEEMEI